MNAAIIQNNLVINVIEIEQAQWNAYKGTLPNGQILVASGIAGIGDSYNPQDGSFTKPTQEELP